MRQHGISGGWNNSNILNKYRESIAYDANGNILKYLRHGADETYKPLEIDSLTYKYNRDAHGYHINNKLNHVRDQVSKPEYKGDIDDQELIVTAMTG